MFTLCLSFLVSWGSCVAAVVAPMAQVSVAPTFHWEAGDRPECRWLYYGSALVGGFNGENYHECNKGVWNDKPSQSPVPVPAGAVKKPAIPNYGLTLDKMSSGKCSLNGGDTDSRSIFEALERNSLSDDSGKAHITVYGDKSDCDTVLKDLQGPDFSDLRDKFLIKSYAANHWAVMGVGFPAAGKPSVVVQAADGKVLHAQHTYDGPVALATALRKVDPRNNPDKWPDQRGGVDTDAILKWLKTTGPFGLSYGILLALGLGGYFLLKHKKGSPDGSVPK